MPRKKQRSYRQTRTQRFGSFKWMESYSSFLLGVVVVIVAVLFGVSLIRQHNSPHIQQTTSLSTGPVMPTKATPSPTPGSTTVENNKTYYIVKPNDSLWTIALAVYSNGDKWINIAKANNLANPSTIFTGDKLVLPNAPTPSQLGQMMQHNTTQQAPNAILGNTYTVQKNDSLWDIAVRAYGDGYQWTKIAQANNLSNPDLIFSGNVLTIPR